MLSASKQFVLPSPPPILASLTSYDPPTVISVSPNDDLLFAYFPGCDRDGAGCLWRRGLQVDNWAVKEWWNLPRGGGVIAASWAGSPREVYYSNFICGCVLTWIQWVIHDTSKPARLPSRGPATLAFLPTLLLVTENQCLSVCYFRNYAPLPPSQSSPQSPSFQIMSCSLTHSGVTLSNQPSPILKTMNSPGGVKYCSSAAIGLGYGGDYAPAFYLQCTQV
jgi:hypothetical protein